MGKSVPDDFSRVLEEFPTLTGLVKKGSSGRVLNYMTGDLRLAPPKDDWLERPGYSEVLHALARDGSDLFEHPKPAARLKTSIKTRATRLRSIHDQRFLPPTPKQIESFGSLKNFRKPESDANARIDLKSVSKIGLSADQIVAVRARGDGYALQSSQTAEYLDWPTDRLERTRRLLALERGGP